jgi:protein-tyrosine phosphatase
MVFRSAYLNDGSAAAKEFIVNELGVRFELDIRGSGAACLGSGVKRRVIGMQWYSHIFTEKNYETTRQTIAAFADPANYPMNFHCAVGRDRTGTTAFLILGLLGVDEETLVREYYSSFLSEMGTDDIDEANEFSNHVGNIHGLINGLSRYAPASASIQERIEAYLLTVGVTEAEMNAIRDILLED